MTEDSIGLMTTWGREFAQTLARHCDETSGQDALEVFARAFGGDPTLARLKALGPADIARLAQAARDWLEAPTITDAELRAAVDHTLWHWAG